LKCRPAAARHGTAIFAGGWRFEDYLKELLEAEVPSRRDHVAKASIHEARFPDIKTVDQIDWAAMTGVSRPAIAELATCGFVSEAREVVIAGPIGTGKTHLAIALGVEGAPRRFRVVFTRAAELVRQLVEAGDARLLGRLHQRLSRAHLLIVDELGLVPFERTGGELLFNLLAERHEHRSTMITTNLAFSEWVQVLGDEKLTTALLGLLASRGHILTTQGPSYRTRSRT